MIHLRGHHLFCMTLFSGHGYDERFTENMAALLEKLKQNGDERVLLMAGDDNICAACPNLNGTHCRLGNDDVQSRDAHARHALSVSCGRVYLYSELRKRLASVSQEDFDLVCGNCTWWRKGFCSYEMFRKSIE